MQDFNFIAVPHEVFAAHRDDLAGVMNVRPIRHIGRCVDGPRARVAGTLAQRDPLSF
jgi:hypothetical protein